MLRFIAQFFTFKRADVNGFTNDQSTQKAPNLQSSSGSCYLPYTAWRLVKILLSNFFLLQKW